VGGAVNIRGSQIYSNSAATGGGALYITSSGRVSINNSQIDENRVSASTGDGGGIYNQGMLSTTQSTFSGNSALAGGGIYNWIGTVTLSNDTLSGNHADLGNGGGIANYGGALLLGNVTLSSNAAAYGGGIYNGDGKATLADVT